MRNPSALALTAGMGFATAVSVVSGSPVQLTAWLTIAAFLTYGIALVSDFRELVKRMREKG